MSYIKINLKSYEQTSKKTILKLSLINNQYMKYLKKKLYIIKLKVKYKNVNATKKQ